jgi:hypothetical protein
MVKPMGSTLSSILQLGVHRGASLIGGMPNIPKKLLMGANQYGQGLKVL